MEQVNEIKRVALVGGGVMGTGIAEVCARAGVDVTMIEVDEERVARARDAIARSLHRAVSAGKLDAAEAEAAEERLELSTDLGAAAGSDDSDSKMRKNGETVPR